MIITKQKDFKEILSAVEKCLKIFIVGCGECATTCKTGGEKEVKELSLKLKDAGKEVVGVFVGESPCVSAKLKSEVAKSRAQLKIADAVIVLACGLGVQSFLENARFQKEVVAACDTIFSGVTKSDNSFIEYCSSCGECIINLTGGICPVTRCPKSLMNGPCAGAKNHKCEVDIERDCVWIDIYKRLKELGRLDDFLKIKPAKDFSKQNKPRKHTPV